MRVSKEVFLESGSIEKLEITYFYLKQHEDITEEQLVEDLKYTSEL